MTLEVDALDQRVATTVAASIRKFRAQGSGSQVGQDFEQLVFKDLLDAHDWRYATGPDQFGMGLQLASRTGTAYEFDGVFGTDTTLYVIEAKHLVHGSLIREHIGIFLQKLLDTLLGSYYDLARFAIKPVVASARPAWGEGSRRRGGDFTHSPSPHTPRSHTRATKDYSALSFTRSSTGRAAVVCPGLMVPSNHLSCFTKQGD